MRQLFLRGYDEEWAADLVLELQAAQEIYQRDPLAQSLLIGKDHVFVAEEGLLQAGQAALLELEELEVLALEDDLLGVLFILQALGLLTAALGGVLPHERLYEGIEDLLLLTEDFGIADTLLALQQLFLDFEELRLVIDHLGVDQPPAHAYLPFFSQKILHLAHIVPLQSTYRLP